MSLESDEKLVAIDELELMWSKWRSSGPIWTEFGISDERSAAIAKKFAREAIRVTRDRTLEEVVKQCEMNRCDDGDGLPVSRSFNLALDCMAIRLRRMSVESQEGSK